LPSYERWSSTKNIMEENSIGELAGAIKNALERGENLTKIKQSFINAGYSKKNIEAASQNISQSSIKQPTQTPSPLRKLLPFELKQKPTSTQTPQPTQITPQPKTKRKILTIILIAVSALILAGAAILGFFWDKIF